MRRRRKKRSSELTSLVDVLFILLFAALIQARGVASSESLDEPGDDPAKVIAGEAGGDAGPADAATPDGVTTDGMTTDGAPPDATATDANGKGETGSYRAQSVRAAETMASAIDGRPVAILEITAAGRLEVITLWIEGVEERRTGLSYPLLEEGLPKYEVDYRGERNRRHKLCAIVRDHLDESLSAPAADAGVAQQEMVVLITLDTPVDDLPLAFSRGLEDDIEQCFNDFQGFAIFIQPPLTE